MRAINPEIKFSNVVLPILMVPSGMKLPLGTSVSISPAESLRSCLSDRPWSDHDSKSGLLTHRFLLCDRLPLLRPPTHRRPNDDTVPGQMSPVAKRNRLWIRSKARQCASRSSPRIINRQSSASIPLRLIGDASERKLKSCRSPRLHPRLMNRPAPLRKPETRLGKASPDAIDGQDPPL